MSVPARCSTAAKGIARRTLTFVVSFSGSTAATAAELPPSFGLVAHWSFDRDYSSGVNNALYAGTPHGGVRLQIDRSAGNARIGAGALKVNSALRDGEPAYVAIGTPPAGLAGTEVLTLVAWFKFSDVGGDGSDARNFVWESFPNSALTFSLNSQGRVKVPQYRFRSTNYRSFQGAAEGVTIRPGGWHHVASVGNARARHVRVYVDGKLAKESALNDADGPLPIRGLHLGGKQGGRWRCRLGRLDR